MSVESFHIVKGHKSLRSYHTDGGIDRVFCITCGSPIVGKRDSAPEIVRVRIGTLDTPIDAKVSSHIFVGSKAEWDEILDGSTQHVERPE